MSPRKFYSLSETCRQLKVKPHVLRYWEKAFAIHFQRNSAGRRIVASDQLEQLQLIKHLLHHEKLTVQGARKKLAQLKAVARRGSTAPVPAETLAWLKKELIALRTLLESEGPTG